MFNNISEILERPKIYTQSDMDFWDDEHISKQMLRAHLNPLYEGAGFNTVEIFSDVAGTPYIKESPTIAILLRK